MWPVFFFLLPFFLFHVFQPGVISKLLNAKHVWNITAYRPYRGHVFHAIFMRLLTVDVRHHVELASRKQHGCYFHWIMHVMAVICLFLDAAQYLSLSWTPHCVFHVQRREWIIINPFFLLHYISFYYFIVAIITMTILDYCLYSQVSSNSCAFCMPFKKKTLLVKRVLLAAGICHQTYKNLTFAANVIVPQATHSREGGATQHGWRRLSDVTGDDSQSQSRAGRRPGAGGRELIRGPGVTRIRLLVDVSLHPSAALFLSHRPPARLETTPQSKQPQLTLSLSLSPLGLFIEHASGWRPVQRNSLLQPFGIPKHDRHEMPDLKKKKINSLRPISLEMAWPHTVQGWWTHGWGKKTWNIRANHVPLKASGLIYCQKGRRFMFVNNPTPSSC